MVTSLDAPAISTYLVQHLKKRTKIAFLNSDSDKILCKREKAIMEYSILPPGSTLKESNVVFSLVTLSRILLLLLLPVITANRSVKRIVFDSELTLFNPPK